MSYRVLVVDDCEPWRRHICSTLQKSPRWQVIGEVADGLEAVHEAHSLKPDLILLDIGLPTISGIQVARRILAVDPGIKILFVSQHRSWDVAEAALGTGARGYIFKPDAGTELLPAIEAIAEGKRFIGSGLGTHVLEEPKIQPVRREVRRHDAIFSLDEKLVLESYGRFAEAALRAGNTCIVWTSDSRRVWLQKWLQARGLDLDLAVREGRYRPMDAAAALAGFMVEGWPDEARFREGATTLFSEAFNASLGDPPRVAACGDGAGSLWREGREAAAIRLEQLWNEFARTHDLDVLCGYQMNGSGHHNRELVQQLCAEHSAVHSE